jgi:Tfp pilus assembly protein PilN
MSDATKVDLNTVTLDPVMIRDIENLMLSKQLAEAEAKLAQVAMMEAQRKAQQARIAEAAIVEALEKQTGRKLTGKIELLDRDKGLCRLA